MNDARFDEISKIFAQYLERKSPPLHFRGNPPIEQREAMLLLQVLLKWAPASNPAPFVRAVLKRIEARNRTRIWPSVGDLEGTCSEISKSMRTTTGRSLYEPNREEILVRRLEGRDAIGEDELYSHRMAGLVASGRLSPELLEGPRKRAHDQRVKLYGAERAERQRLAMLSRYEDALAQHLRHLGVPQSELCEVSG